jgi:hypothetical protein
MTQRAPHAPSVGVDPHHHAGAFDGRAQHPGDQARGAYDARGGDLDRASDQLRVQYRPGLVAPALVLIAA